MLRTNLATSDIEWKIFEQLFFEFWQEIDEREDEENSDGRQEKMECDGDSEQEFFPDLLQDQKKNGEKPQKYPDLDNCLIILQ